MVQAEVQAVVQRGGQAGSQRDRLTAALEAVVIGDRMAADRCVQGAGEWQSGLLQTAAACVQGSRLEPLAWRAHFQALPNPVAVSISAFPVLWVMADAHGHRRASVHCWGSALGLSAEAVLACEQLFTVLCQTMKTASGLNMAAGDRPSEAVASPVGQALALVGQSQGQFTMAQGLACRRGWNSAAIALVSLLAGMLGGRASLGSALRQRWLLDYSPPRLDPWRGLEGDALVALAAALHGRWAGVVPQGTTSPGPLGLRG
ncbi:hypothetical protein PGN35_028790 [Nodosilinea sp. PGN35]|uniref:hypothetical protein n=1 Tax=Nodosilinea sp. PGN35 TaxID=3020489 RepID=UPI0023B33DC5|nr:hypothetical protein [Nodosilinea sp. TSF1-S3]MDF0365438.1 hypothetical protein [Nodosilinea sp. TSF1-S3]